MKKIAFLQLPEDMQQLVCDFVSCDEEAVSFEELECSEFSLYDVPVSSFPSVKLSDGFDRGKSYAIKTPLDDKHPVVLAGVEFLDGRHRLYKARRLGRNTIMAINLSEVGVVRVVNSMGSLRRPLSIS